MPEHTGGMIALLPDADTTRRLALDRADAEPARDLHVTLAYLGDDVTEWPADRCAAVCDAANAAVDLDDAGPVDARVYGHATFNPDGGPTREYEPCGVYLVGDCPRLVALRGLVLRQLRNRVGRILPIQHYPFTPHVTAGYGLTAADLAYTGPVRFDRMVVALADVRLDLPLWQPAEAVA